MTHSALCASGTARRRVHCRWSMALTSCAATLLGASAALADDTEIFVNQGAAAGVRPNVLFIVDTSGSMNALVQLDRAPYNAAIEYQGPCDRGAIYYQSATAEGTPACDGPSASLPATVNRCAAAATALGGVAGRWTGRVLQWQASEARWRAPRDDNDSGPIECEADAGVHGETATSGARWARNGDSENPWTALDTQAVSWAATGTYALFAGNYLNWLYAPSSPAQISRLDTVKAVATSLAYSIDNVNLGLMRFSTARGPNGDRGEGGLVAHAIAPIGAARDSLVARLNSFRAQGFTPLSETLYEAGQYLAGRAVEYGLNSTIEGGQPFPSVPESRLPEDPSRYRSPIAFQCQRNYVVLLTDGEPTEDNSADARIRALPEFASLVGSDCDGSGPGRCLDDMAEYLFDADLSPQWPGRQNAVTYTIGFGPEVEGSTFLEDVARRGGGRAYAASNVENLTEVLQSIFSEVLIGGNTFVSPSVSINAFNRAQTRNELYISLFQPSDTLRWVGNVKKYGIRAGQIVDASGSAAIDTATGFIRSSARSFWTPATEIDGNRVEAGGAAARLPAPAERNVYTYVPAAGQRDLTDPANAFDLGNTALDDARLNTAGSAVRRDDLIRWARGVDVLDVDGDGNRSEASRIMGDPLHARPALVAYGGSAANPSADDEVIFVPTNDGFLHAIDARTGIELWSFIPPELLGRLVDLYRNPVAPSRSFGLDGDVRVLKFDVNQDGIVDRAAGDRVWIFFGMRRGGSHYYALDVTQRSRPVLRWSIGPNELPGIGESWSTPTIARVRVGGQPQNGENFVLVFGGGYDDAQENYQYTTDTTGHRIYMVDAASGRLLWYAGGPQGAGTPDLALTQMTHSITGRVVALDLDGDQFADRMYAADLGGRIWRFDVWNGRPRSELVTGGVLAALGAGGTGQTGIENNRRFYYAPDVALIQRRGAEPYLNLAIGSGYRGHPLHTETRDRFYAVRDRNPFAKLTQIQYDALTPITDTDLVNITPTPDQTAVPPTAPGWKLELNLNGGWSGEKVLAEALTVDGTVLFTSYQPVPPGQADPCRPANGINRAYALRVDDGRPFIDFNDSGVIDSADLFTELAQSGIAGEISLALESVVGGDGATGGNVDALGRRGVCVVGVEVLQRCIVPGTVVRAYWRRVAEDGGGD